MWKIFTHFKTKSFTEFLFLFSHGALALGDF